MYNINWFYRLNEFHNAQPSQSRTFKVWKKGLPLPILYTCIIVVDQRFTKNWREYLHNMIIIRQPRLFSIQELYDMESISKPVTKHHQQGKAEVWTLKKWIAHTTAIEAVARKLIYIIFAILRDNKSFKLRIPRLEVNSEPN